MNIDIEYIILGIIAFFTLVILWFMKIDIKYIIWIFYGLTLLILALRYWGKYGRPIPVKIRVPMKNLSLSKILIVKTRFPPITAVVTIATLFLCIFVFV